MRLIAIDPGPTESGICILDEHYKPLEAGKTENLLLLDNLTLPTDETTISLVIEMVGHYGTGMPAGKDVFETCVWIGRFLQWFEDRGIATDRLERREVKLHLCGNARARDSNIRQALVDRFAPFTKNYGKGTKKAPGWFYGFASDAWQAYALGVTFMDFCKEGI